MLFSTDPASPSTKRAGRKSTTCFSRFFGNSRERLLLTLLGDGDMTPDELQRLKNAIAEAEASDGTEDA